MGWDGHMHGTPQHRDTVLFCRRDSENPAGFIKELRANSQSSGNASPQRAEELDMLSFLGKKKAKR